MRGHAKLFTPTSAVASCTKPKHEKCGLIRRNQPSLLQKTSGGDGYIIDVKRFHVAVRASLTDYLNLILEPQNSSLRSKLWDKMNHICRVREARGVLYEAEEDSA